MSLNKIKLDPAVEPRDDKRLDPAVEPRDDKRLGPAVKPRDDISEPRDDTAEPRDAMHSLSSRGSTAGPSLSSQFIPIVLCAGFGTRLKPITNHIPKVICPIIDKPLAFFSIEKFFQAGFEKVYCNTHYLPELVEAELKACAKDFGYDPNRIVFFYEKEILGSGGGILNIVQNLSAQNNENKNKDVIVASGDVVADFPLSTMLDLWKNKQKDVLALMLSLPLSEARDDILCVSQDRKKVVGFGKSFLESEKNIVPVARLFSNHQIISAEIFKDCAMKSESSVSMFYKKILSDPHSQILHADYPESLFWFNVGDTTEYAKCIKYFIESKKLPLDTANRMHFCDENLDTKIKQLLNLK